jgi:hypothetical protein
VTPLSPAELAVVERFEAAAPAPESSAIVRAVLDLADSWRYKGEFGWGPWQTGEGPDIEGQILDDAALAIRRAVSAALNASLPPDHPQSGHPATAERGDFRQERKS